MFRAGARVNYTPDGKKMRPRSGGLFGQYTRWPVAVENWRCRVWYFHATRPRNRLQQARDWLLYWTTYRWLSEYNFSQQDVSVMESQRFDCKGKLSGTDAEVIQWRRLVVTKHFGGRTAEFDAHGHVEDVEFEPNTEQGFI